MKGSGCYEVLRESIIRGSISKRVGRGGEGLEWDREILDGAKETSFRSLTKEGKCKKVKGEIGFETNDK